jgi:hypothetical protein
VLGVLDRVREQEHRSVVNGFSDAIDDELVAILVVSQASQRTVRKFVEPAEMVQLIFGKLEGSVVVKRFAFGLRKDALSLEALVQRGLSLRRRQ